MDRGAFERLVTRAIEDLPAVFRDSLDNVEIVVEDECTPFHPGAKDVRHRRLVLGLYQGVPLSKRSRYYGMVLPDKISIFKKNIEKVCSSDEQIVRCVTHTVQHELAHHFGISDERLRELGLY